MKGRMLTTYELALAAVAAAFLCVVGPFTLVLPVSPVPLSIVSFAVGLTSAILGVKAGTLGCLLYLLIGFAGLPVFSGFTGGVGCLLGPTGGYLFGYLFLSVLCGMFAQWFPGNSKGDRSGICVGVFLGHLLVYGFGSAWLAVVTGTTFSGALAIGVFPFLLGDLLKTLLIAIIAPRIRGRLRREKLLT